MSIGWRAWLGRVIVASTFVVLVVVHLPSAASAAVGGALRTITPTATGTTVDKNPTCGTLNNQGGTSIAIVQGSKVINSAAPTTLPGLLAANPALLAITCLDPDVNKRSTIYFINLASGNVVTSFQTTISGVVAAPVGGWAHLVNRPDKGDLLACGTDGTIYSIAYFWFNSPPAVPTGPPLGTATKLPRPSTLANSCGGLAWDPAEGMIYQGLTSGSGKIDIARFKDATSAVVTFNTPASCTPTGLAITGGVLVVACNDNAHTILRYDKNTPTPQGGALSPTLSPNGTLTAAVANPLGDLACDPVTFSGQFRDAMWSRNGLNGNGVVAVEFPPFTCGLPGNATVFWAGLSAPSGGVPGAALNPACFDAAGNVKDSDGDGLPDCWETPWGDGLPGIDFDGDGNRDVVLCVDENGNGVFEANECARPDRKDLFVEIDWMQDHQPDPLALRQTQSVSVVGVQSVQGAFAAAPVCVDLSPSPACVNGTGIRLHIQVNEQVSFTTFAGTPATHVTELVFTPCTPPAITIKSDGTTTQNVKSLSDSADFDVIKKANFGTAAERASGSNTLNAKRLAFRYMLFGHNLTGPAQAGSGGSGCSEVAGDDAAITLGSFAQTTVPPPPAVGGVTHNRGLTDQQAGTVMHEFGHNLGLDHGGHDRINCKPNYLSVMSYTRQFAGSPIPNRRLDYSSAQLLNLNKVGGLNEGIGLGGDVSLGPEPPFFPSADQTAFGPNAWSVVTASQTPIDWDRVAKGPGSGIQTIPGASAALNSGPLGGCDGSGTTLEGHDDWDNLLYRASAALDFAGGVHTTTSKEHVSITSEQEQQLFLAADLDGNGVGDGQDCGWFDSNGNPILCTHRIDIKPSFPVPKTISQGVDSVITVAIFSEQDTSTGNQWDATTLVHVNDNTLKLNGVAVKVNQSGQGTCSVSDVADPVTGQKDGFKDLRCQFPTNALKLGTQWGVVTGIFTFTDDTTVPPTILNRNFSARQLINVVP